MLEDMQAEYKLTYLFIAHDISVVRYISTRIGVMYLGKLIEITTSAELYKHPLHPYTKTLFAAVPVPDPKKNRERRRITLEGDIPSPINPPSGCRFRTRCPQAEARCAESEPEFKEYSAGHWASCHLI
jgi:oligopeptide transport system ATP-binding protein